MYKRIRLLLTPGLMLFGVIVGQADGEEPPANAPKIRAIFREHGRGAHSLVFSPDGKMLATGGQDRTVKLWDAATGKVMASLEGHAGSVWGLAFSPDGRTLVAGSGLLDLEKQKYVTGEIKVWDVAKRSVKETIAGHTKVVNALMFSPDGKMLASASDDASVKLWDVGTGTIKLRQVVYDGQVVPLGLRNRRPPDAICSVAFSPDGKLLAWGNDDLSVTLWDVAAGKEKASLKDKASLAGHGGGIRCLTFSPDGTTLASTATDYTRGGVSLNLWEVATAKERASYDFAYQQTGAIHTLAFSQDGRALVSGNNEGIVKLRDLESRKETILLNDQNIAIYSLKYSPNGTILAAVRSDGSLVIWEVLSAAKGNKK